MPRLAMIVAGMLLALPAPPVPGAAAADVDWTLATKLATATGEDLWGVSFNPADGTALVVGTHGLVLRYEGGVLTTLRSSGTGVLNDVAWAPDGHAALIAGGDGTILRFANGTFELLSPPVSLPLHRVRWMNARSAIVVGGKPAENGAPGEGLLLLYSDSGRVFFRIPTPEVKGVLYDAVSRHDGSDGVAVGAGPTIVRWDYNGTLRLAMSSALFATALRSVDWSPIGEAVAVGDQSTVVATPGTPGSVGRVITGGKGAAFARVVFDVRWPADPALHQSLLVGDDGYLVGFDGTDRGGVDLLTSSTHTTLHRVGWKPDGSGAIVTGSSGTVLLYPGIPPRAPGTTSSFNPAALLAIGIVGGITVGGFIYLHQQERRAKEEMSSRGRPGRFPKGSRRKRRR